MAQGSNSLSEHNYEAHWPNNHHFVLPPSPSPPSPPSVPHTSDKDNDHPVRNFEHEKCQEYVFQ